MPLSLFFLSIDKRKQKQRQKTMRREIYIFHPKSVCASPGAQKLVFLSEFTFVLPAMHRPGLSIVIGLSCIENIYSRYGSGEASLWS